MLTLQTESGETMRAALRAILPDRREHDVVYAVALHFNGEEEQADLLLDDLLRRRQEEARAASAYGFILQARGDARWREMFERARRAAGGQQPEVKQFVEFWTAFAEAPEP